MEKYQWSSTKSGLLFLGICLPSLLSIPLAKYGQGLNRRKTVAIELILALFPFAALPLIEKPSSAHQICFVALVACIGLFMTTSQSQVMVEVSDAVREIERKNGIDARKKSGMGTGYAFCSVSIALGQFLGPLIAGFAKLGLGWGGMSLILGGTSAFVGLASLLFYA